MGHNRLEKDLKTMNVIMVLVGISQLLPEGREKYPRALYVWQLANVVYAGMTVASMTWYIQRHTAAADVGAVGLSESVGLYLTFWIVFVKLLTFLLHRDELQQLTDTLVMREFAQDIPLAAYVSVSDNTRTHGTTTTKLRQMLCDSRKSLLRTVDLFTKVWAVNAYLDLAFFITLPLILEYIYPGQHYKELPLGMSFPWKESESPLYELSYLLNTVSGFICIATYVGPDPFFSLLVGHIIRQLRVVGFILFHLDDLVTELVQDRESERDTTTAAIIASCAQHYSYLKGFCAQINSLYAPFFLVQVLCTSSMLCLSMFTIATDSVGSITSIKNIMYSGGIVAQIGVYCFVIERLIQESERMRECIVERWWAHSAQNRSSLRLFHAAVHRPITMNMFGSTELCHATFGTVMRTSYTYFTFLRTVTDE